MTGLGHDQRDLKSTRLVRPGPGGVVASDIFFVFANVSPLGDQGPEQFYLYPRDLPKPWLALENPRLGRCVFLGSRDPAARPKVMHLEMLPGNAETPRWDGNWPRPDELAGLPAGVVVSIVDFANHPPGTTYEAAPAVLQFHDGDTRASRHLFENVKAVR